MLEAKKLSQLLLDVADCYTELADNKFLSSYITRSDTDFAPKLRGYVSGLKDNFRKKSNVVNELENYLNEKVKGKEITSRVYQLTMLLLLVVKVQRDDIASTQIQELLEQVEEHRNEVVAQENNLSFLSQDPAYLNKFHEFTDRVETILTRNLPKDEQAIQAQQRLDATVRYEQSTKAMVAYGIDAMTSPVAKKPGEDEDSSTQDQLVKYMEQLAEARARHKQAEQAKLELEAERTKLATEQEQANAELNKSKRQVDHFRQAMKDQADENRVLKQERDELKDQLEQSFVIDKDQFKLIVKSSPPLQLAMKLIQLSIMIERVYQQFENNGMRDTGQSRNIKAYYNYFTGLLPCLTDADARQKYIDDRNSEDKEAILDADKRICKAVLCFVLGTAEYGAYTIADLNGPVTRAVNEQGASEEATKEFYAAIEAIADRLKKSTGVANEFYKLAFHIDNGDFDRTVRVYGKTIVDNKNSFLALAHEELGIKPKVVASETKTKAVESSSTKTDAKQESSEADGQRESKSGGKKKGRGNRPGKV